MKYIPKASRVHLGSYPHANKSKVYKVRKVESKKILDFPLKADPPVFSGKMYDFKI